MAVTLGRNQWHFPSLGWEVQATRQASLKLQSALSGSLPREGIASTSSIFMTAKYFRQSMSAWRLIQRVAHNLIPVTSAIGAVMRHRKAIPKHPHPAHPLASIPVALPIREQSQC